MNLNQVSLPARDVAASARFYRRLGFLQIVNTPHYARFECTTGDATFSVSASSAPVAGGCVVYFECEDVDGRVAELEALGFEFLQLPRDERWRWREAVLLDPSGNRIKLYTAGPDRRHPPWRVERRADDDDLR